MRTIALLAVIMMGVSSLGAGALAEAQPRRGGSTGTMDRREQIKRKIRALRAYTLTEELALDEHTAGRLFPLLSRYDDEIDRMLEKRRDLQHRLGQAHARDARAIDRLVDEAVANQRGFWELEDKRLADLRKILTPVQVAKLLVVLPAFDRRIQNQLGRAIVKRRPLDVDEDDDGLDADDLPPPPRRREAPLSRVPHVAPHAPRGSMSNAPGNTPPCDPSAGPCR